MLPGQLRAYVVSTKHSLAAVLTSSLVADEHEIGRIVIVYFPSLVKHPGISMK